MKREKAGTKAIALIGPAAFYIGLLIVIAAMFIEPSTEIVAALAVLGLIVGLLNITAQQTSGFLLASIAFIVASWGSLTMMQWMGVITIAPAEKLVRLAGNLTVFVGVAVVIIALKAIYEVARSR